MKLAMKQAITLIACVAVITCMASVSQAEMVTKMVNISVGETATLTDPDYDGFTQTGDMANVDGVGTEVIGIDTWNNLGLNLADQALIDSDGVASGVLTARVTGSYEYCDTRIDSTAPGAGDTTATIVSLFVPAEPQPSVTPMLTISGFTPNSIVGTLTFWGLGDFNNVTVTQNLSGFGLGVQPVQIFHTGANVFTDVIANGNGEIIVAASNHIAAVQLTYQVEEVPEPSTFVMLIGLCLVGLIRRRR